MPRSNSFCFRRFERICPGPKLCIAFVKFMRFAARCC